MKNDVEDSRGLRDVEYGILVLGHWRRHREQAVEAVVGGADEDMGVDVEEDAVCSEEDNVWRKGMVLCCGVKGGGDRDKGGVVWGVEGIEGRRAVTRDGWCGDLSVVLAFRDIHVLHDGIVHVIPVRVIHGDFNLTCTNFRLFPLE